MMISAMRRQWHGPAGRMLRRWGARLWLLAMLALVGWQLGGIGWRTLWDALPHQPAFYLLFTLRYLAIPVSDMLIYQFLWGIGLWRHLDVFLQKRALNFGVLGYAGEAYFVCWATGGLARPVRAVAMAVKDVNILSAMVSNLFTLLCLALMTGAGGLAFDRLVAWVGTGSLLALAGVCVSATLLPWCLRRHFLVLTRAQCGHVLFQHAVRLVVVSVLQILQWALVLPAVSLTSWLLLLTASMVINRLPLLPNKDLLVVGGALVVVDVAGLPEAAVAAVFVANAGLSQLFNGLLLLGSRRTLARVRATPVTR